MPKFLSLCKLINPNQLSKHIGLHRSSTSDTLCTSANTPSFTWSSSFMLRPQLSENSLPSHCSSMELLSKALPARRDGLRSVPLRPLCSPPSHSVPGGGASAAPRSAARRSQTGWRVATRGAGVTGRAGWAERDNIS